MISQTLSFLGPPGNTCKSLFREMHFCNIAQGSLSNMQTHTDILGRFIVPGLKLGQRRHKPPGGVSTEGSLLLRIFFSTI